MTILSIAIANTNPATSVAIRIVVGIRVIKRMAVNAMSFPRIYRRRPDAAQYIDRLRDSFKMFSRKAGTIPAKMIPIQTVRGRAIHDDMGQRALVPDSHAAITIIEMTNPDDMTVTPTWIDEAPESLFRCKATSPVHKNQRIAVLSPTRGMGAAPASRLGWFIAAFNRACGSLRLHREVLSLGVTGQGVRAPLPYNYTRN